MSSHRLIKSLTEFHPEDMEQLYGSEWAVPPLDPNLQLAPIKRVALVAESFLPKVDGVSKTAFLTLRYLQQTGREVIVLAPDLAPQAIGQSRVVPLPSVGLPMAPETRMAIPHPVINQTLHDFQPDLIHMFSPALVSITGMLYARQNRIPVIANYQTDLPAYAQHYGLKILSTVVNDWLRNLHNGCHLTLAPSNWTLNQLRSEGYHRLRRWGRGVNTERFNPNHRSQAWREKMLNGRDPNALLCLYVGRLANEKRIDLLLEVARTPGVALTIIGDGYLRDELETQFAGTNTHFMGYIFGEDLGNAYASADVFMFPGESETFGQVVQEALASGLPAVIIHSGGITDQVQSGINGFICNDDPAEFARAARTLRDDPTLRKHMAHHARLQAEKNPWSGIMAQLETHYQEAVDINNRFNRVYPPMDLLSSLLSFTGWSPRGEFDRVS